jgi:hypothetical protein
MRVAAGKKLFTTEGTEDAEKNCESRGSGAALWREPTLHKARAFTAKIAEKIPRRTRRRAKARKERRGAAPAGENGNQFSGCGRKAFHHRGHRGRQENCESPRQYWGVRSGGSLRCIGQELSPQRSPRKCRGGRKERQRLGGENGNQFLAAEEKLFTTEDAEDAKKTEKVAAALGLRSEGSPPCLVSGDAAFDHGFGERLGHERTEERVTISGQEHFSLA